MTDSIDWEKEDRGKFKHPDTVGDLRYDDLEKRVFQAIDAGRRTLMRVKEHAGLERSFDLSPVIEGMDLDKKIRIESNGTITAFFRYQQRPTWFWLNGDGTVSAEFDENFKASDSKGLSKLDPREMSHLFGGGSNKGKTGAMHIDIDPYVLEKAAEELASSSQIAKSLGIGASTLFTKLKQQPALRDAYDRGRHKLAAKEALRRPKKTQEEKPKPMNTGTAKKKPGAPAKGVNYTVEMFYDAAKRGMTLRALAQRLSVTNGAIVHQMKKPEFGEAWDRGLADQTEKRTERRGHVRTPMKPRDAKAPTQQLVKVEKVEAVPEPQPAAVTITPSVSFIPFQRGGRVIVGFEGNFFDATPEERRFLNQIAVMFESYPEA